MTDRGSADGSAVYELTIAGSLGPVLQAALGAPLGCRSTACTLMRAGPRGHRDVVDLVSFLDSKGLAVEEVTKILTP